MSTLREVVRLARHVREENDIKHRHPLRLARVAGLSAKELEESRELLEAELNVKVVEHLADPASVVRPEVVLDYSKLGKRLRGGVKEVARAVQERSFSRNADGSLEAAGHRLEASEYSIRFVPVDGQQGVAAEGGLVVALDLTLDEALVREGIARDLNRAVQDLRKQARLGYDERIVLSVVAGSEIASAVEEHGAWLREQCLATKVVSVPLGAALASDRLELGGDEVTVAIERAGAAASRGE
jgi:isoleucyl-tRNA synthetase